MPYFDPLTGETVDVTAIYGGAGNLQSEDLRTRTLSLTANPLPKYRLQLNLDYLENDLRNQIGALPPPSSAVVAAFPDRFQPTSVLQKLLADIILGRISPAAGSEYTAELISAITGLRVAGT